MTKDEALDLALEALKKISKTMYHIETPPVESLEEQMRRIAYKAITAIKQARALDKKAENARELGLDYEPVPENFMDALRFDVAMRDAAPVQSCYCPNCEAMGKELAALKAQPAVQQPFCFYYVENGEEYFAPKGAYVPDNAQPLYTTAAQPAIPDAFGTREGEHPQYIQGWNDCRAEMLRGNT